MGFVNRRSKQNIRSRRMNSAGADLQHVCEIYCRTNTSRDFLYDWVRSCLHSSFSEWLPGDVVLFRHKRCFLEYNRKTLYFTAIKSTYDLDAGDGTIYDIGVCVRPLLNLHFGTDDINVLKESIELLDEDFHEISDSVTHDLDMWCSNVEDFFKVL